jgi:syntaxin 7
MSQYQKLNTGIQDLVSQVKDFQHRLKSLRDLSSALGTPKDNKLLRAKLTHEREETISLSKRIVQSLRDKPINQAERMQHEKLAKEFEALLGHYTKLNQQIISKEKEIVIEERQSIEKQPVFSQAQLEQERKISVDFQNLGNLEEVIIRERNEEIKSLEKDIAEVNAMFVDVANMVHEQGIVVDEIDQHTQNTHAETTRALADLNQAENYQARSKSKLYCILGISLFGVAAALAFVLALNT